MKNNQTVNYTKHLELFFAYWQEINYTLPSKERFSPIEITLYYQLFHQWNHARFAKFLDIHREEVMQSCGIGNHITYTNSLKTLEKRGLLRYFPSQSRYKASQIELLILTDDYLQQLITTLCKSEQSTAHSSEHSTTQSNEHSSAHTTEPSNAPTHAQSSAPLYQTIQTKKTYKQANGGNSADSPPPFLGENCSLSKSEMALVSEKVVQWCNFVRTSFLDLPELLKTKKEIQAQTKGAMELYENLHSEKLSFEENLKIVNERFTLYAQFLKSKPNDTFLREMFTPQGIVAQNIFQQFEQGASDVKAKKTQVVHVPQKWNEQFYCDLLKNKQTATAKLYEAKLKEELGLEVYFSKKASKWGVRKINVAQP
ncbi:MAG: hypothetical protein ACKVTZ_10330 [Bacteroidia bacterium]